MKKKRILIANRGEIALRIIRAARELGHTPIVIYSDADRSSLAVKLADEAYCVGPGPSQQSYLNQAKIIEAIEALKIDLVHPGYGFLSENAQFVSALEEKGVTFIGPSADIIEKMGDKVRARETMDSVGLPLVPGVNNCKTEEDAFEAAKQIGFPVMIKAASGGGGRGMRIVESEDKFKSLYQRASSEALKAFGDGRLYVEKFIGAPHHIEVQIMADMHGNTCHVFERECSVQRRHQKVIEESPSPFLTPETRNRICEAAREACEKLGYVNAGTIEFLVDENQDFYFMEMNTRLQVEHPVTEMTSGIDLAKEQILVALGEKLSFKQTDIKPNGHSFEFRIYAEDPQKYLPQAGTIETVSFPRGAGVRIDSHIYSGYEMPVFYDSMIAKISVWGRTREEAIARSIAALSETTLTGIKTNLPLHLQVLKNEIFCGGNYTTKFLEESFKFVPPEMDKEALSVMTIAAVAYHEHFEDKKKREREHLSRWRTRARQEALRL